MCWTRLHRSPTRLAFLENGHGMQLHQMNKHSIPLPKSIVTTTALGWLAISALAQGAPGPAKFGPQWQLLIGEWVGESAAGGGSGQCAFRFGLDQHVIVRTNHAQLAPSGGQSRAPHDDFMMIYPAASGETAEAVYVDNEGHVIHYDATWAADGNTLTFLSKPGPGPQFRLVYTKVATDVLSVNFAMAPPGQPAAFKEYTSGRMRRTNK
jgi:hypothetical protein